MGSSRAVMLGSSVSVETQSISAVSSSACTDICKTIGYALYVALKWCAAQPFNIPQQNLINTLSVSAACDKRGLEQQGVSRGMQM